MSASDYIRLVSIKDNVIHIELDGFWSDQVIDQFGPEMQAVFENAVLSLRGKRYILLADWSGSPIFGRKAEAHVTQSMVIFKKYHGYKVVEVAPKTLLKMGLKKAAAQTEKDDFRIVVSTLAEAHEVIERLKREMYATSN